MPYIMTQDEFAFGRHLLQAVNKEPSRGRFLLTTESTRHMREVVESLALEGDPEQPRAALALLQELSEDTPEEQAADRFTQLVNLVRQSYRWLFGNSRG